MSQLFSTAVAAQDISTAKLIKTWTAPQSYDDLKLRVLLSGLAGNGSYQACATVQPGGAGPAYQTPTAAGFAAATVTTMWLPAIAFPIASGDVLKVYVQGLAGDNSIDAIVALWEGADVELGLTTQGYTTTRAGYIDVLNGIIAAIWSAATRTLTAFGFSNVVADQVWDEAIAGHLNLGSTGKALDDAGAAGDPLMNPVPGTYASGTAGAALGSILTGRITVVSPMSQDGLVVKLIRGDDYLNADGRSLTWTDSGSDWPDLTGATVRFKWGIFSKICTVIGAGGAHQQVSLDLTSAETRVFEDGTFNLEATLANTHIVTIVVDGDLIIRQDL